jgi:superfamily II DNA/RNA helicase
VITSTIGKLKNSLEGKKPLDMGHIRCLVIDEADYFFSDKENFATLTGIFKKYLEQYKEKIQFVLFSATYPPEVQQSIATLISEGSHIRLENKELKLSHIHQFQKRLPKRGKIDFVNEMFKHSGKNQTMIFVNTKKFAAKVCELLNNMGCKCELVFGDTKPEERDRRIQQFRDGSL